jgi:hypothetical protein
VGDDVSHFTVLCVTNSADELNDLLAPYDEGLEVELGDKTTYNPNSKWDWYAIGGRWANRFLLRSGGHCDQAPVAELDLAEMLRRSETRARERWDDIDRAISATPTALLWDEMPQEDIDARRSAFWAQPRMQAIGAIDRWGGGETVAQYQLLGRDRYLRLHSLQDIVGYALLTAEGWAAQGEMGWFGCGSDTAQSSLEHVERTWNFVCGLPPSAWLTNVDCHI